MAWNRLGQFKIGPQNIYELHLVNVYKDSEFIEDVSKLPKSLKGVDTKLVSIIAEKYAITKNDIQFYQGGYYPQHGFYRKKRKPFKLVDMTEEYITIRYDVNITKEDFNQSWVQFVDRLKESDTKNKLPVFDELLYAIFKARKNGLSFGEIFKQYSSKKLPYYLKTVSGIDSEQKLKDYYAKFQP